MLPMRKYNGQNWLPVFFNDFFNDNWTVKNDAPAVNVTESATDYKLEIAAPGMKKDDFSIRLDEHDRLTIAMEKKDEAKTEGSSERKYLRREFSYAKFQQSFVIPEEVDKSRISASMTDGVLTIDLPKRTPEEKEKNNRMIEIL